MFVNHSGWSAEFGSFDYNVFVNENKDDYEIHYKSGRVAKQLTKFEYHTHDWNNDGDIYTLFGAFFGIFKADGSGDGRVFMTVEDMVFDLVKGVSGDTFGVDDPVVSIIGIEVPTPDKRPSLDDNIRRSERQQMMQEINEVRAKNGLKPLGYLEK